MIIFSMQNLTKYKKSQDGVMRTEKEIRTYFEEKGLEEMLGDLEAKTAPFWRPPERLELEMRKTAEGRGFIYIKSGRQFYLFDKLLPLH